MCVLRVLGVIVRRAHRMAGARFGCYRRSRRLVACSVTTPLPLLLQCHHKCNASTKISTPSSRNLRKLEMPHPRCRFSTSQAQNAWTIIRKRCKSDWFLLSNSHATIELLHAFPSAFLQNRWMCLQRRNCKPCSHYSDFMSCPSFPTKKTWMKVPSETQIEESLAILKIEMQNLRVSWLSRSSAFKYRVSRGSWIGYAILVRGKLCWDS